MRLESERFESLAGGGGSVKVGWERLGICQLWMTLVGSETDLFRSVSLSAVSEDRLQHHDYCKGQSLPVCARFVPPSQSDKIIEWKVVSPPQTCSQAGLTLSPAEKSSKRHQKRLDATFLSASARRTVERELEAVRP